MQEKSIPKNVIYNMLKMVSSVFFPLVTLPYINRVLMPENVGIVNFGTSFVAYFSLIATLGVSTYAIRECSRVRENQEEVSALASQIFSINVLTTVLAYVLLFLSLFFFASLKQYTAVILIQCATILFTTLGTDWINSAFEDFKYIAIRTVVVQMAALVAIFVFVKAPADYLIFAAILMISSSGANVMNIFYRKRFCAIRFTWKTNWRKHLPSIFLLFSMLVSQTIFSNSGITALGLYRSNTEVGWYSVAYKIFITLNMLIASILWVVLPRLSFFYANQQYSDFNRTLTKIFGYLVSLGFPLIISVGVMAEDVVLVLAGEDYLPCVTILRFLMIASFFSLIGGGFLGNLIMLPTRNEKFQFLACFLAAIANVFVNIFFVKECGMNASLVAAIVAEVLIFLVLLPCVEKKINLRNCFKLALFPFAGSILVGVVLLFIQVLTDSLICRILISIGSAIPIYCLFLWAVRYEIFMDSLLWLSKKVKVLK